jgi:aminopeptidase N
VLSSTQRQRLAQAVKATKPVLIVTPTEAAQAELKRAKGTKTWTYVAKNVRDFAWASSRKFIWDAMGIRQNDTPVMCMSYYPKEGNPLWGQYSTEVVAHTIKTYSKFTIPYQYPVAISVHGPVGGMEYPMICFNGGRPEKDGTYTAERKYGMISVIIHEVGHNFFPMIINSDERQWTWMDEGLNTFVQYLTEQEWQRNYPSRRGEPAAIVDYMRTDKSLQTPIMTNSESLLQFGNNAYGKPATGLNILRETILGRPLFDYAFKEYARRWAYKHPTPADFFRTMEDASGTDLDWFWRGWFYTTEHTDLALPA